MVKIILESESTSYVNASTAEAIKDTLQSKFENIQTVYLVENETAEGIKEFIDLTYRGLENESI